MERIRELREAKKYSQLRLGMELDVAQETISGYEIGRSEPNLEMLVKLADVLDTSVDYILGRTDIRLAMRISELSEQEIELLAIFRRQAPDKRAFVCDMIKGLEK